MERGRRKSLVSDAQWTRYLAAAPAYLFETAPQAHRNMGLSWKVTTGAARIGTNSVVDVRSREEWEVSGIPLDPYEGTGYSIVYYLHRVGTWAGGSSKGGFVPLHGAALRHVRPGRQTFRARLVVDVFDPADNARRRHDAPPVATRIFEHQTEFELLADTEAEARGKQER